MHSFGVNEEFMVGELLRRCCSVFLFFAGRHLLWISRRCRLFSFHDAVLLGVCKIAFLRWPESFSDQLAISFVLRVRPPLNMNGWDRRLFMAFLRRFWGVFFLVTNELCCCCWWWCWKVTMMKPWTDDIFYLLSWRCLLTLSPFPLPQFLAFPNCLLAFLI